MNIQQLHVDFPEVQAAIYGVALSLDAFLVNGIQYGVMQQAVFNGFLQKAAGNLLRDLANLEKYAAQAPATRQLNVREVLVALRNRCQQMIDLLNELSSFKTLPLGRLRSTVSQIPLQTRPWKGNPK